MSVLPDQDKVINDEYLSKEQVAFLVSAMKKNFRIDLSKGAIGCATQYEQTAVKIKLSERLSARTSNVNDTFTAKTTQDVVVNGISFPAGRRRTVPLWHDDHVIGAPWRGRRKDAGHLGAGHRQ